MKKLAPKDYFRALPLIQRAEIKSHLALVHSLLEGRQEGEIFVDQEARPETVLVCPRNGFYFLFGEADNPCVRRFLPELLSEHLVDKPALFATSAAGRAALDRLFARKISRIGFEFRPSGSVPEPGWRERIPPGVSLAPMTRPVIEPWSAGLDPWVIDIWGGPDGFAAKSFGFCLLYEGRMVSFTAACGIGGGEAEVEVGTAPEFRGRGLATLVGSAFIEHCQALDLIPAWSAAAGNLPSLALGRRLGFVEQVEVWGYPLEPAFIEVDGVWGPP